MIAAVCHFPPLFPVADVAGRTGTKGREGLDCPGEDPMMQMVFAPTATAW